MPPRVVREGVPISRVCAAPYSRGGGSAVYDLGGAFAGERSSPRSRAPKPLRRGGEAASAGAGPVEAVRWAAGRTRDGRAPPPSPGPVRSLTSDRPTAPLGGSTASPNVGACTALADQGTAWPPGSCGAEPPAGSCANDEAPATPRRRARAAGKDSRERCPRICGSGFEGLRGGRPVGRARSVAINLRPGSLLRNGIPRQWRCGSISQPPHGSRYGRSSPLEPVPHLPHGVDMLRLGRVGLELLAQLGHVGIDRAGDDRGAVAPHLAQQIVP